MVFETINIKQMAHFVMWGVLNTALSLLIYMALVYAGLNILAANAAAVMISVLSGHFFNKKKVFKSDEAQTLRKYCLLWLGLYVVSSALILLFVGMGANKYMAAVYSGAVLVPISFIVQKLMIFLPGQTRSLSLKEILK